MTEPSHNNPKRRWFSSRSTNENEEVDGLDKSRRGLLAKIGHAFKSSFDLDDALFEELEDALIASDIGVNSSLELVEALREHVSEEKLQSAEAVIDGLVKVTADMLAPAEQEWTVSGSPYVIIMVGVNGVGKTTTTAKIACRLKQRGKSVMLAAADTFRAAAVEQLQTWGERLDIPVISQSQGSDAAAVAHDAMTSARSRQVDVLLIDTAGRLHTQTDLMQQLQKVLRVVTKIDPTAPHEVMQVVDATTGQNALNQVKAFTQEVAVSSLCLTKLDGSAKGGMAIALSNELGLPIRFTGVGESFDDLKPFVAHEYASALIPSLAELQQTL